jgi:hypothetical protein
VRDLAVAFGHFVRQVLWDAIRDLQQPEDVEEPTGSSLSIRR